MKGLLWNVLLALAWAAVNGQFTLGSLLTGFALGFAILLLLRRVVGAPDYAYKARQAFGLAGFFVWELVLSNLRVAYDVITPNYRMRPGVVAIPLDVTTDAQITLLANLITLTPGTLTLDVSDDRRTLYLHAMYVGEDVDAFRRGIKEGFERRILEVLS
jgi:multicomponent Na+:H+ antiporter subunit E